MREFAQDLLRAALDVGSALELAPLILRVGHRGRGAAGVDLLGRTLRRASRGQLAVLFSAPDRTVRRFAYRLAVEGRLLPPAELARAAAQDQDTVVQDLCATAALTACADLAARGDAEAYESVSGSTAVRAQPAYPFGRRHGPETSRALAAGGTLSRRPIRGRACLRTVRRTTAR